MYLSALSKYGIMYPQCCYISNVCASQLTEYLELITCHFKELDGNLVKLTNELKE